jgi:hypothetical protein
MAYLGADDDDEMFNLLREVCEENIKSRNHVFEWQKRFSEWNDLAVR